MIDELLIRSLGLIILAAAVFVAGARLVRLPGIVACLLAGLMVGPLLNLIPSTETTDLLAEVGIVLLLFLVGMELSFDNLRNLGRVSLLAGLGQVVATGGVGFLLCLLLGFPPLESAFLAVALTLSSTVVAVKLLEEKKEFQALHGRISIGILLFQDLVVILLLAFLAGFGQGGSMDAGVVAMASLKAFAGMAVLLFGVLGAARYLLPRPFAWAARSPETLFIWSLCWCFIVVFGAHAFHLSHEIGAFLAGLGLAQLPYTHELRRRVHPLMNFFVAVFFVGLGIRMDLGGALAQWPLVLGLSLFVVIGKVVLLSLLVGRLGFRFRTALLTGVTLSQISEFSLIFTAAGLALGLIGPEVMALVGLVALVTISVSSCLIVFHERVEGWTGRLRLARWFPGRREAAAAAPAEERSGHVIVVGMNTLGRELVRRLADLGERILAIDTDPKKLAEMKCETLLGNVEYLSLLEEAGLPKAKLVVSALQIEDTNNLLAFRCRSFGVPCSIHATDMLGLDNLLEMNVSYLMLSKVDGVKLQTRELKRMGVIGS